MNKALVVRLLGAILMIEAAAMLPSLGVALLYGDGDAAAFGLTIVLLVAVALPAWRLVKPRDANLRAREGFAAVGLAWVLLSLFGALPFVFSGVIPQYVDALFETVSGLTTTGATLMTQVDGQPHGIMFWRCFTHWIGGMGVLVLSLAILPKMTGRASHLARAESPGPVFSKIVPKLGDTAKIMYLIYGVLTVVMFVVLLLAGMGPYDAALHAMSTAGTGGFSNYGASIGAFHSPAIEVIVTVFMVLFGVNFALYYRMLVGGWRDALKNEELHWFLALFAAASLGIGFLLLPQTGNLFTSLRYSAFQVASLMSTTGYATADYTLWPQAAQAITVLLLFTGACAGSTAGGLKMVRVALLCKLGKREIRRTFQPRKVQVVRFEGKGMDESVLSQVAVFFFVYLLLILLGMLLISLDGIYDFQTNFTATLTCVSNVGPGLGAVGPAGNFAGYSAFSKLVLSFLMLCGRLELFPMLALLHPSAWRKG